MDPVLASALFLFGCAIFSFAAWTRATRRGRADVAWFWKRLSFLAWGACVMLLGAFMVRSQGPMYTEAAMIPKAVSYSVIFAGYIVMICGFIIWIAVLGWMRNKTEVGR